jgi:hypothetical protein
MKGRDELEEWNGMGRKPFEECKGRKEGRKEGRTG